MDSKNIDKLFKEKLNNLEVTPDERVWNNIESKLQKKKRKILPLWWFPGGVAALFLLGLLLFPFSDDTLLDKKDSEIIITETPKEDKKLDISPKILKDTTFKKSNEKKILVADKNSNKKPSEKRKRALKNSNDKKKLVSTKNAMKKVFLAENEIKKDIISSKEKEPNSTKKSFTIPNYI